MEQKEGILSDAPFLLYWANPNPTRFCPAWGGAGGDCVFPPANLSEAVLCQPQAGHQKKGQSESKPAHNTKSEDPRESSDLERKKDSADVQFSRLLRKPRKRNGAEFF